MGVGVGVGVRPSCGGVLQAWGKEAQQCFSWLASQLLIHHLRESP